MKRGPIPAQHAITVALTSHEPPPIKTLWCMKLRNQIPKIMRPDRVAWLVTGALVALGTTASAVPYASGVSNNAGTVSFILNESATNVLVVLSGGPGGTTNLSVCAKGAHSFALGGNTAFSIQVSNTAPPGWTVSSDDLNPLVRFYSPRGVAVNCNPTNLATFGRIYVANATPGTNTGPPASSRRFTGRGIYLLNADQTDIFGQGTTERTAGIVFDSQGPVYGAVVSPFRVELGPDGCLYVCDYSINTGTLYRTDPDVTTNLMVLQGQGRYGNPRVHTTIAGVGVEGSLERSNLTVYAVDGGWANGELNPSVTNFYNGLLRWRVGSGPVPWNAPPEWLAPPPIGAPPQLICDLDRGPDGKFYFSVHRGVLDAAGLTILGSQGTNRFLSLWNSLSAGCEARWGVLQARGIKVACDGSQLAIIRPDNQVRLLLLTNGIPDPSRVKLIDAFGNPHRPARGASMDVAFDAAGNLYAVGGGAEMLRVLSPGGVTVATTAFNGTNGSFNLTRGPTVDLLLDTTTNTISEAGPPGAFMVTRIGDTNLPLTVYYTMSGTASNALDYTNLPGSIVIPAGAASVKVFLSPIDDDLSEPTETATMTLTGSTSGTVGLGAPTVTISILDNDTPVLTITGLHTNIYEGDTNDYATVLATRRGDLSQEAGSGLDWLGGTAILGKDYEPTGYGAFFPTGVCQFSFPVAYPLNDTLVESPEDFSFRLAGDPWGNCTVGTNAVMCVIRDSLPEGPVLFSETFQNPADAGNWNVKFAARNGINDYIANFGCVYGTDTNLSRIPPAPHSADPDSQMGGLYLTANKNDTNALGAAGVNLYPVGQSFSGDYALRFDMHLSSYLSAASTEHAIFGINHSGAKTNWFRLDSDGTPGAAYDGLWFQVSADGSGYGDYVLNSSPAVTEEGKTSPAILASRTAASLKDAFLPRQYRDPKGVPANRWADVEVSQVGAAVTLKINGVVILSFTNSTPYTAGNIMLGYDDPFDSVGDSGSFVLYDNVRVYRLVPVISPIAAVLLAENCSPANNAVDPGETVTMTFALGNIGSANTSNLVVSLLAGGGVSAPSGAQSYGILASGTAASRPFTFTANGGCGANLTPTLQLQDGTANLGTVSFNLSLGQALTDFAQDFDGVVAPALPGGWTSSPGTAWTTATAERDTAPNAVFATDPDGVSDKRLTSPTFTLSSTNAALIFRHKYDLAYDSWYGVFSAGVLEISINGGVFTDILAAGGSFLANGYTDPIYDSSNPLAGREGWSGKSDGFVTTSVSLPSAAAGKAIQLRWRLGSSDWHGATGWRVDTISVLNGSYACCSCLTRPTIMNPCVQGQDFMFLFQTTGGQTYHIEYKNALTDSNWIPLRFITGDGSSLMVTNSVDDTTQRFFRIRVP
jgi:hypothetical protein